MKRPDSFLTNTTTVAGRLLGQAKDNPGDNSGSGMVSEIYNDPAYAAIAVAESHKEGGISDSNETTTASDLRDAIEEMVSKKVSGVSDWLVGTSYSAGDIVMYLGFQFVSYLVAANIGNTPITNPDKWFKIPTPEKLLDEYFGGLPEQDLSPIADRAGTDYQQNIAYGEYRLGGNGAAFYDFFRVHLDGTQVTGDAGLVAIFDVGGANEYFNIDLLAPDVLGTRTLLDLGDYVPVPQSNGGDADTMASLIEDQMQQITGILDETYAGVGFLRSDGSVSGAFSADPTAIPTGRPTSTSGDGYSINFDSANSPSARTGTTTHGKRFNTGAAYVVVMQPA